MREATLFAEVLEKATEADRQALLDSACNGDLALRRRIERLLASHERQAGILDQGGAGDYLRGKPAAEPAHAVTPSLGSMIGPYQLKELLGEGGFGLVFSAEQQQPLHRHVALKIIKPGMDTRRDHRSVRSRTSGPGDDGSPEYCQGLDAGCHGSWAVPTS